MRYVIKILLINATGEANVEVKVNGRLKLWLWLRVE